MGPTEIAVGLQAASMIFGFMGGNKAEKAAAKAASQQHEMDLKNWEFNWEEAQDAYTFALEDRDITLWNLATKRKYENEAAIQEWIDEDRLRVFDYANQIEAYNASIETYEEQLEFNSIAAAMAANAKQSSYQDELDVIGFQHEELLLTADEREERLALEKDFVKQTYKEAEAKFKIGGLEEKRLELEEEEKEDMATLNKDEITERIDQAEKIKDRKKDVLDADVTTAKEKRQLEHTVLRNTLAQRRMEAAGETEKTRLESLAARGKARNLGQKGRSARKNIIETIQTEGLLAQAISDTLENQTKQFDIGILRADEDYRSAKARLDLERTKVTEEYTEQKALLDLETEKQDEIIAQAEARTTYGKTVVADKLTQAKARETLGIRKVDEEDDQADLRDTFAEKQLLKNIETRGEQFDIDFQKLALDKYQQDIAAQASIAPKPILAPQASLPLEMALPQLGKPRKPRKGPKPIKYASSGAGMGLAGLAQGMGGLASAVAGIGGTSKKGK